MEDRNTEITNKKIVTARWVCYSCGMKYGHGPRTIVSTWSEGFCDICSHLKSITEFRDFGEARGEFYEGFPRCGSCDGKGYMFLGEVCPNCEGVGYLL